MSGGIGGTTMGEVLGASTAIGAGVAMMPNTGDDLLPKILIYFAIALGSLCLSSFILTRLLRKTLSK